MDMFDRINTGSKTANKAEIRRGALAGPFMNLVIALAQTEPFVSLSPMTRKRVDEREREELVARFFAYSDGLSEYRDRPAQFVFEYTKKMNLAFAERPEMEANYRRRFQDTMEFVERVFPFGFRRAATGNATPRARFEAIAIGSWLALEQEPDLVPGDVSGWLVAKDFADVTGSDGANALRRLRERMAFVTDHLLAE